MESIRFTNDSPEVEIVSTGNKLNFSYLKNNPPALPTGPDITDIATTDKKRSYKRRSQEGKTDIIKADAEVVESTLDTYRDNLGMLKNTIAQIDELAFEVKQDFNALRSSKVVRGKYQYSSMLSKNLTDLLNAKVAAIKELNTTIKNSNDLDYRKAKDRRDQETANDDQAIMNLYNAFVSAPISQGMGGRSILGPSTSDMTVAGATNIITANNSSADEIGYNNYIQNLTPEQNLMRYENDPNVREVVVFDKATGQKHFDVVDMRTNQPIPNVPRKDDMFLESTTIDPVRKVARNISLNETYPVIVLNENAKISEY